MVRCGLGMQQCAMHNATIQNTNFFELGVLLYFCVFCLFITIYQFLVNFLLNTVPVSVDEVAKKGYTEQCSRVRTIAGTAGGEC